MDTQAEHEMDLEPAYLCHHEECVYHHQIFGRNGSVERRRDRLMGRQRQYGLISDSPQCIIRSSNQLLN